EEKAKPSSYPQSLPPIAPRVEERFITPPKAQPVPKRTTKPLADRPTSPPTRTLTPRSNPFMPSPKPEAKPRASGDSVTSAPLTWSSPEPNRTEPNRTEPNREDAGKSSSSTENPQVETEIIEMMYAVNQLPIPEAKPASLWLRILAGACDFEIIATAYLPLFGAYATLNTALGGGSIFLMGILMGVVVFIYQLAMLSIAGRTFGMAMLNLNLVNTDDDQMPVTRRQKMLRAWAATFAFLLPPINLMIMRLNRSNRSLPDLISGTTITGR